MDTEEPPTWLVAGLGNPGPEYRDNRHNIGFMVAGLLAERVRARMGRHRRVMAEVGEGRLRIGGPRLVIVRPLTYMNLSGGPVGALCQFYKIPVEYLLALHDELDIPFGQIRIKRGGGEGGHNGLRSISKTVGSREYVRVRFGIGRPPGTRDPADYVLSDFAAAERKELGYLIDRAADAVEAVIEHGVERAQNTYHGSDT